MSQQELLKTIIRALEQVGIDYMLTGSFVSSLQGEPRSTHDIDFVVTLERTEVPKLAALFPPPAYYLDEVAMLDALSHESMFNLIHVDEGDKVDFWLLTGEPFDQSRFARRRVARVGGEEVYVSSPEDTILAKLRWAALSGGSEKQFTDALRVYEVQQDVLDPDYLEHWSRQLGVEDLWNRLKASAKSL
ncbi:MAG TPA: hypothetical protein ENN80_11520 [Candidatus Hydrogenedentes bacterium]|nr:hypothetical protein [Candidatus Hydrogenedentota bacterium]